MTSPAKTSKRRKTLKKLIRSHALAVKLTPGELQSLENRWDPATQKWSDFLREQLLNGNGGNQ